MNFFDLIALSVVLACAYIWPGHTLAMGTAYSEVMIAAITAVALTKVVNEILNVWKKL